MESFVIKQIGDTLVYGYEAKLDDNNKAQSYKLLNECDNLINKIRIPRGKLRNMARKQGKIVNKKLIETTEQLNQFFNTIQKISYDFVKAIDESEIKKFDDFYSDYENQIQEFAEKIPLLKREIREFGIY